jgi:hypothetical protein
MSLYGLKGKIEKTERDSETSTLLHTIWIKVHGVPDLAREVDAVKEIIGLVAEPDEDITPLDAPAVPPSIMQGGPMT